MNYKFTVLLRKDSDEMVSYYVHAKTHKGAVRKAIAKLRFDYDAVGSDVYILAVMQGFVDYIDDDCGELAVAETPIQ